jgi:deazaflavin-dependent oxidoreductase (nitroreductase family)
MLPHVDPYKRRGPLYLAVARISSTRVGAWISVKIAWKLDPPLLKLTNGRISTARPLRAALLESRGARTGRPRSNATLYFHDGEHVIIIASKRGSPENPAWYYNLLQHPDIVFGGVPFRAEAVEEEAERQRLWQLADRVFPEYERYRREAGKTGRVIPIFRLIPR